MSLIRPALYLNFLLLVPAAILFALNHLVLGFVALGVVAVLTLAGPTMLDLLPEERFLRIDPRYAFWMRVAELSVLVLAIAAGATGFAFLHFGLNSYTESIYASSFLLCVVFSARTWKDAFRGLGRTES